MTILGLDASTTIIGWCIFEAKDKIVDYGHIDLPSKKYESLFHKLDDAKNQIYEIIEKYDVKEVLIEEALQKFGGGGTNAHTMNSLIAFNFSLSYMIYTKMNKSPIFVNVNSARGKTGIKFPKKKYTPKEKKEIIRKRNEEKYPEIIWEKKKTGSYKDFCYDISDAIIIGEYFYG